MANFELARKTPHLIVQPADAALSPPESYLFVQDGLIIACGVIYALCYTFCIIRTYSDHMYPGARWGSIQFMGPIMAYELYYAVVTTTTTFERLAFLAWFMLDISFVATALRGAHAPRERWPLLRNILGLAVASLVGLKYLGMAFPDEREQMTAYWTGILLQFPIGYVCLGLLWSDADTRGHSLEIWLTRYLGCFTAYGVFFWRYWNIPQNWSYVGSPWSVWIIILTLVPETLYPFVYYKVHNQMKLKGE
ncbi:uncharacterized protein BDW47DRAFT_123848 [Aspergillus candidus]|uniref:Uncharacterized protein n=1 Tax=Aspergillus candidus TaxID=41067 RepID=A0A2I2FIB1_ASPCN|nr:hypothetical protein BDW47DRAFT_123848 [Aspergillus candidus]PLB40354.1 hypothetical protein BDW47DRAFT_123848 [Aspergillus candidus]